MDDIGRPTRPPDTDDTPDLHLGKNKPDDAIRPRYESSKARMTSPGLLLPRIRRHVGDGTEWPPEGAATRLKKESEQLRAHVVVALGPITLDHRVLDDEHPQLAVNRQVHREPTPCPFIQ